MTTIELIYNAIKNEANNDINKLVVYPKQICAFTGQVADCVRLLDCVSSNFVRHNQLLAPNSIYASIQAYQVLHYKNQRSSSWFCDGKSFQTLDRKLVRQMVLKPDMPNTWAGYATTSYKKHGALACKVNTGNQRVWQFEEVPVDCSNMEKTMEYWNTLNHFLRLNISRTIMESLECPPYILEKIGIKTYYEFRKWAENKYLSPLYSFLVYLLPSQEELKLEVK